MPTRRALPALLAAPALAQEAWSPSRPIRLIVTFAPGGSADTLARRLAEPLSRTLGQSVVVENRPGAGGNIGLEALARSAPDGHSIGMGAAGPLAINPALPNARMPYDAASDFTPLLHLANQPNVLLAHPSVPAAPLPAFTAWLRGRPGELFASPGNGTSNHLTGIVMAGALGGRVQHVPYRGSAPAQVDLLAGTILLQVDNIAGNIVGLVNEGRMKAVAVSTAARSALLPEVPAMPEFGAPALPSWQGILAPRGLPPRVTARLNQALAEALQHPSVAGWLREGGAEPVGGSADAFAQFLAAERGKWAEIIRANGITAE